MKKKIHFLVLFLFLFTGHIYSAEVFINGTNVTGIKDQDIKNCNLKIDNEGNIHIEAPDVKIVTQIEKPLKSYFIAISVESPLPSDFKVSLNGKVVGKLDAGKKESLIELGNQLKKGENIISYLTEPAEKPIKFTLLTGTGIKKDNNLEFTPVLTEEGVVNNLGAAGNYKFNAE
jgi:hypothetical protein